MDRAAEPWLETLAATVRVIPEFTVKLATLELLLLKVIELIFVLPVTVMESPARITTLSVGAGTAPPATHQLSTIPSFPNGRRPRAPAGVSVSTA